jgi:hypothetical protein
MLADVTGGKFKLIEPGEQLSGRLCEGYRQCVRVIAVQQSERSGISGGITKSAHRPLDQSWPNSSVESNNATILHDRNKVQALTKFKAHST